MLGCCGAFKLRKKRKSKSNRKLRVNLTAGTDPPGTKVVSDASTNVAPASLVMTSPGYGHRSQRSSDHDGEFFDCESEFSETPMERTLSQGGGIQSHPSLQKSTQVNGTCSPDHGNDETVPESRTNYFTLLWDLLSWKPAEPVQESRGLSEELNDGAVLVDNTPSFAASEAQKPQPPTALSACLSLIHPKYSVNSGSPRPRYFGKPIAGASLQRLSASSPGEVPVERWEPADPHSFSIRSDNYMKTKLKISSEGSFYETIGADVFSFDQKSYHIGKKVVLPQDPYTRTEEQKLALRKWGIPEILVLSMLVPKYEPSLFGGTDGPGHCLVYYCVLREGFNPDKFKNRAAVGLLHRLIHNAREQNADPSRERLKLIPRVVNVEEWAVQAPLSKAEKKLLTSYNEKPILSRPQHAFFSGPNYFEIDFDIHSYAYLARKAFSSLFPRLKGAVFENAVVMQGNKSDELPEYLLACVRIHRVDFTEMRYFSDMACEASKCIDMEGIAHDVSLKT